MAKRIDVTKIKIGMIVLGAVIILLVAITPILGGKKTNIVTKDITPAFAPAEYAYPEFFTEQELDSGYVWKLNSDNTLSIRKGDDTYTLTADGSVYKDSGSGLQLVDDDGLKNEVLSAASEAQKKSDAVDDFFSNKDIDALILPSDDEIGVLTNGLLTPEQFKALLANGLSKDDILELLKSGYDPSSILELSSLGLSSGDLKEALAALKSIDDRLAASIAGSGISLDEFKRMLDEYGMTPEQYLAGLETMQNTSSSNTSATTAVKITTKDVPSLTVNLGGSTNSVVKQEQAYQQLVSGTSVDPASLANAIASATNTATKTEYETQNNQGGKNDFINSFSSNKGMSYLTTNDVAAGTIITMTLKTGINTDLPGMIVAEVSQNVFDSLTGRVLLIPKGTRLIASYDSSVSWGQKRALIAWTQLIRPDGLVLQLPGFSGVDKAGYSGYNDKVDNHTWELIKSAFLSSILDLGASEINLQAQEAGIGTLATALGSFTNTLESAGQQYLKKQMNIQPTLTIRPGRTVKLLVNQTITLTPYIK